MERVVRENISFQRGINSKESLNVGEFREREYPTFEEFMSMEDGIYLVKKKDDVYDASFIIIEKNKNEKYNKIEFKIADFWKNSIDRSIEDFINGKKFWYTDNKRNAVNDIFNSAPIIYVKKLDF